MRHVLGVLGVLAAGVLLAVSCAMNYRFGFSLGRTELDGQIYGAASAAADCLKALVPFFFFAAIKNKVWSQAAASALVWVVVTAYSMTSALGHAALNRFDTTGHRAQTQQSYQDLRADLKRAEEKNAWVPQHRPFETVKAEIDGAKTQAAWKWSDGCTKATGKSEQKFCQSYHALNAELAAANEARTQDAAIAALKAKLSTMDGDTAMTEADPQARVLADIAALVFPGVSIENVQMAMTIFVALLLEIGSGFGMYVGFSQWRLYDAKAPTTSATQAVAQVVDTPAATAAAATPALTPIVEAPMPSSSANDNRSIEIAVEPVVEAPAVIVETAKAVEVEAATQSFAPATTQVPLSDGEKFARYMLDQDDQSECSLNEAFRTYERFQKAKNKPVLSKRQFGVEISNVVPLKKGRHGQQMIKGFVLNRAAREAMKPPAYAKYAA